jgi:hypothetical protein
MVPPRASSPVFRLAMRKLQSIHSFWDFLQAGIIAVVSVFIAFSLVVAWIRRRYFSTKESQFPEKVCPQVFSVEDSKRNRER